MDTTDETNDNPGSNEDSTFSNRRSPSLLYSTKNIVLVNLLMDLLKQNDIEAELWDDTSASVLPVNSIIGYRIMVLPEELETAKKVLNDCLTSSPLAEE